MTQKTRNSILYAPISLAGSFISFIVSQLRPFAPQFTPVVLCCTLLPVLVFLSLTAGVVVWRNVAVAWNAPLFLQYGDGLQPYARVILPALHARQRYDISLYLEVAASENNLALGNFMNSLTLYSSSNNSIISVRRPAIVLPSNPSFFMRKPNKISVQVPLLSAFKPGTSHVEAEVTIGRQDGWKSVGNGDPRELSVFSATLKGFVAHHGLRGIATRFPILSSIASSILFLTIITTIVGACLIPVAAQGLASSEVLQTPTPAERQLPPAEDEFKEEEEFRVRRRDAKGKSRSQSQSSRSSRRHSIKNEPDTEPVIIPPANEAASPLRQRGSRRLVGTSRQDPEDSP